MYCNKVELKWNYRVLWKFFLLIWLSTLNYLTVQREITQTIVQRYRSRSRIVSRSRNESWSRSHLVSRSLSNFIQLSIYYYMDVAPDFHVLFMKWFSQLGKITIPPLTLLVQSPSTGWTNWLIDEFHISKLNWRKNFPRQCMHVYPISNLQTFSKAKSQNLKFFMSFLLVLSFFSYF